LHHFFRFCKTILAGFGLLFPAGPEPFEVCSLSSSVKICAPPQVWVTPDLD
jgi:hypothetical protein